MQNSSMLVFSFLNNVKKIIEAEKESTTGIFEVNYRHFNNSRENSKKIAKRIYNDLENHIYTYKDLFIYMLYIYAFNETILFHRIYANDIKRVSKIFTKKQLKNDIDFITKMNETLKLKNVCELFEIKENGESIIYELIKQKYVTPVIFVNLYEKLLTIKNKDVILKSNNYKKFEYAMKLIIKIFKGGLNEQKEICN